MASVHQPSIRAQTAAHDVSIRSSTIDVADHRGWASHSMSRSWQTMDDSENARTGPSALGSRPATARALPGRRRGPRRATASAKFLVVDVIAEHDVEAHQERPGEGHPGLGSSATVQYREGAAPQIVVRAGGEGGGLAEDPAEERVALLGDLAEALFVGGGVDGRGQADVTHDVLAVREAWERAQHQHGGERRQRTHPGMGEQEPGARIGGDLGRDSLVELVDPRRQSGEQLEAVIAASRGVREKSEGAQLRKTPLGPQGRAQGEALVEGDRLQAVLNHRAHPDETDAMRDQGAPIARGRIGNPDGWEAVMLEEIEEVPSVPPIGLRL